MGMYTEIYVNVDLSDDTPDEVVSLLQCMIDGGHIDTTKYPRRWSMMFHGSSYLPNTWCGILNRDSFLGGLSLLGKGAIKNYNDEIEKFFTFIAPFSETEFMGYMRYEEDEKPTLIYRSEAIQQQTKE